jgi:hypothetical protein
MTTNQANVMVDLRQVPNGTGCTELASELGRLKGVRRATVSARAGRLLLVDYDLDAINSQQILGVVLGHGFDARLIGM